MGFGILDFAFGEVLAVWIPPIRYIYTAKGISNLPGTSACQPIFKSIARAAILIWVVWTWRRLRSQRKT